MAAGDEALFIAWLLAGSALGGMARYWLSGLIARTISETFPWGTLVVNLTGAWSIGFLFGMLAPLPDGELSPAAHHFLVIGFLGSYTTVSSFALQTLTLVHDRQWYPAFLNILLSAGLCLPAAWAGHALGRFCN